MTDQSTLSSFLIPFKRDEEKHIYTSSVLVDDTASHRIVSAWTMMPSSWTIPKENPPEDLRELWDWIWSGTVYSWMELSKRSGLDIPRVQRLFEPLRANRLIYPDGTATEHALAVLKSAVVQGLSKSKKR